MLCEPLAGAVEELRELLMKDVLGLLLVRVDTFLPWHHCVAIHVERPSSLELHL